MVDVSNMTQAEISMQIIWEIVGIGDVLKLTQAELRNKISLLKDVRELLDRTSGPIKEEVDYSKYIKRM